jgi:hypothetical protein
MPQIEHDPSPKNLLDHLVGAGEQRAVAWNQAPLWANHVVDLIKDSATLNKICPIIERQNGDTDKRVVTPNDAGLLEDEKLLQLEWQFQEVQAHSHPADVRRKKIANQSHGPISRRRAYRHHRSRKAKPTEPHVGHKRTLTKSNVVRFTPQSKHPLPIVHK